MKYWFSKIVEKKLVTQHKWFLKFQKQGQSTGTLVYISCVFTKFYTDAIQLLHKMCLRLEGPVAFDIVLQALHIRTKYDI